MAVFRRVIVRGRATVHSYACATSPGPQAPGQVRVVQMRRVRHAPNAVSAQVAGGVLQAEEGGVALAMGFGDGAA